MCQPSLRHWLCNRRRYWFVTKWRWRYFSTNCRRSCSSNSVWCTNGIKFTYHCKACHQPKHRKHVQLYWSFFTKNRRKASCWEKNFSLCCYCSLVGHICLQVCNFLMSDELLKLSKTVLNTVFKVTLQMVFYKNHWYDMLLFWKWF